MEMGIDMFVLFVVVELGPHQATDTKSEGPIVAVGRVQPRRVQVQVARREVAAVHRPTPIVAVRATSVRRRTVEVAGVEEIIWETSKAITHDVTRLCST